MIKRLFRKLIKKSNHKNESLKRFEEQFDLFKKSDINQKLKVEKEDIYPCLHDNTETTGFDAHYIYHPAWAARIIREINPSKHIDISSTLHFCSILSAFIPTEFYDYRPAKLNLSNLVSGEADLTNLFFETSSIDTISCMHTVEHIGLGRYGDPIDPDGDIKAIDELIRVVKPGGSILFVTPVGNPKIMFNAHRIYDPHMITNLFKNCELKQFSLVTDQNEFIVNSDLADGLSQNYGCGCFWFIKN
ncbi:DUF268 domain-containing protein [Pedobacter chinensis]|uniref:DUF268 domain-containing protein n=1 Tax=Pedobacter chinensis TaxID=2282421 RepID=A0A369PYD6_9SPHI|nr:DUF268 domain-containing protein [Pedobacter chinensis]RDC56225.1 DUF268 domain-containing protein [Pedobacter chinensis]